MNEPTEFKPSMTEVRVDKRTLIETLKENANKHDAIYEAALDGFWTKAEKDTLERLNCIKAKEDPQTLYFQKPQNCREHYDSAIRWLEMSLDQEVFLNADQFKCYVLNKWNWRDNFVGLAVSYVSTLQGYSGYTGYSGASGFSGYSGIGGFKSFKPYTDALSGF